MRYVRYLIVLLSVIMGGSHRLMADDFNPSNPAEPYLYSKLTVTASPTAAVSSLSGAGYYKEGTVVTLRSYAQSSIYTFSHWTKDGEWYSSEASPKYTMGGEPVTFTAHYNYTPVSPDEPWSDDNRLYLVAEPLTACTFNITSGKSYRYEQTVSLSATASTGYTFLGWYDGGKLVSSSLSFSFNMPDNDLTLTARFEYDPANPDEPGGDTGQDDVQTEPSGPKGDVNLDGKVSVVDAVVVINMFLQSVYEAKGDLNKDGKITVADAVVAINLFLNSGN